jgi:hypothetical protein
MIAEALIGLIKVFTRVTQSFLIVPEPVVGLIEVLVKVTQHFLMKSLVWAAVTPIFTKFAKLD